MEENRFFIFAWRFNAITLMIAGLLAIGALLFGGYMLYTEITRDRNIRNLVNIQENTEVKETWQLGYLSNIDGTPYVMIPLNSEQSFAQSSYSKSSSSARNYLFINSQDNGKHWLFNTNQYLLTSSEFLTEHDYGDKDRKIQAILYSVVKKDTDKDQRLTVNDSKTIGISKPSGKDYKEILQDVDVFIGHRLVNDNNLLLVYQKNGVGFTANVNLVDFSLTNESELPNINP